jgi:hypothetical protein
MDTVDVESASYPVSAVLIGVHGWFRNLVEDVP